MANFVYLIYIADILAQEQDKDVVLDPEIMKNSNIQLDDITAYREAIMSKANTLLASLSK